MIRFVNSEQDYNEATNRLNQVFRKGVDIVDNPFAEDFKIFKGFEFDRIYSQGFYFGLINFLRKTGSKEFTFYTLNPSPVDYFFHHFSKYSVGRVTVSSSYQDYISFLNTDPGDSPADALIENAETVALYSNEQIWGIIGSKDIEIGIVGFKDEKVKDEFVGVFDNDTFIDIRTRFDDLNKMLDSPPDTKAVHSQMIRNYSR